MNLNKYYGRNKGRLLYFLDNYFRKEEDPPFLFRPSFPMIIYQNEYFADYSWDKNTDIPTFNFLEKYKYLEEIQKDVKPRILEIENLIKRNNIANII